MKFKAVVFDLDGTLVDTRQEYIYDSVGKTLYALGITSSPDIGEYSVFANRFWKGFDDRNKLIRSLGITEDAFWKTFEQHDSTDVRVANSFAYPDFVVLNNLRERGVKTGIVTDAPHYVAFGELKLVDHGFDVVVCASEDVPAKPNIRGLVKCLDSLGVGVAESIYLGNANVDVQLGKNAGILNGIVVREKGYNLESTPDFSVRDLFEFEARFFD